MEPFNDNITILLTGATGYIGGRLLPRLLKERRYHVRCLARNPSFVKGKTSEFQVVKGDILEPDTLKDALRGVHTAIYLVHSMGGTGDFEQLDRQGARNFAEAARVAGVKKIIYVGGLAARSGTSLHLRSREDVGEILRASGVPCIEFRASIIIGAGSLSYEIMRSLCERLPIMTPPQWVLSLCQPIFVDDVLQYLLVAVDRDWSTSAIYEIGGVDTVNYRSLILEYAHQRGLKRIVFPVPLLTPYLSALWLGLVTPVYARIGRKLIESLTVDTVITDDSAARDFDIRPVGYREAIAKALENEKQNFIESRWFDALSSRGAGGGRPSSPVYARKIIKLKQSTRASRRVAYNTAASLGGKVGWLYLNPLWVLRGWIDLLLGGVGMQRGRSRSEGLEVGDVVDCWRVEYLEPGLVIRLGSEMRMPGRAWLQFDFTELPEGSLISQTALFEPYGTLGLVYWYMLFVPHWVIFRGMVRALGRRAEGLGEKLGAEDGSARPEFSHNTP
jgi:uncharacterized protein YbjT (DUF2867 family)